MDYNDKVALVTGGSSGIGLAVARQLAAQGAHVWILGRNQARLEEALKQVRAAQGSPTQHSGCLAADVSSAEQVVQAFQKMEEAAGVPDLLITSAGVTHPGYVEELDTAIFREMIEINYLGTVYCVKAALPGMLRRGSGAIVTVSSIAGFLGTFGYTAYGASKYAVRGFSDTLRAEMKHRGIQVSIVYPPDTDTPQLAYENQFKPFETKELAGTIKAMSADAVALAILKGAARGRYTIIPGFEGKFFYRLTGIVGDLTYPIMDWMISDALKKKQAQADRNGRRS
ncbi:MAG TPA: SDR family oxidoreductase [Anaerolineaceae bacterium]|jgi:3-dehydrosphinganine reductase